MTGIGLPLKLQRPRLPMDAGIVVVIVVVAPSVRCTRTTGIEELREVVIGDRQAVDEEGRQPYPMRRSFIGRAVITAHDKTASRDAQHLRCWLRGQRDTAQQTEG